MPAQTVYVYLQTVGIYALCIPLMFLFFSVVVVSWIKEESWKRKMEKKLRTYEKEKLHFH